MGTGVSSLLPGLKRPGHEASRIPQSTVQVKKSGPISLFPEKFLWIGAQLVKYKENIAYYLYLQLQPPRVMDGYEGSWFIQNFVSTYEVGIESQKNTGE
jgi:hypothetical protein